MTNGFRKLEFVIKGRAHVTFSQSEAKWPLLGWPLSGGGGCTRQFNCNCKLKINFSKVEKMSGYFSNCPVRPTSKK